MFVIDLSQNGTDPLINNFGHPVGGPLAGNLRSARGKINARKAVGWAKSIEAGKPLLLDASDKKALYDHIEGNEAFTPAYEDQLLTIIDMAEDKPVEVSPETEAPEEA